MSGDGQWIAFESRATNLVEPTLSDPNGNGTDVFLYQVGGVTRLLSIRADGTEAGRENSFAPVVSADGSHVVFQSRASDLVTPAPTLPSGGRALCYVRDLVAQTTHVVLGEDGSALPVLPDVAQPIEISADS